MKLGFNYTLFAVLCLLSIARSGAAVLTVTSVADNGAGTLRSLIGGAAPADLITFAANLSGQTITLTSGQIVLDKNLTIVATNLPAGLTINGGGTSRIFYVNTNQSVSLRGLTIKNGKDVNSTGGAIYNDGGTLTLTQCLLSGNSAVLGGAIWNNQGTLALTQCTLSTNSANNFGGGIANNQNSSMTLTDCTFTRNSAVSGGAAIYNSGSATLSQCTLSVNTTQGDGGAIDNFHGALGLTLCTFTANSASSGGGAISSVDGPLSLAQNMFSGNSSQNGGAIYNAAVFNTPGLLTWTQNTFSGNLAANYGGAIYNVGAPTNHSTLALAASDFSGNTATNFGGAIYNSQNSTLTVTQCTLSGNAAQDGAALYNNSGALGLRQCTLALNSASRFGGAICNNYGTVDLKQSTLSANSATTGGGVYSTITGPIPTTTTATNCIIAGNTAPTSPNLNISLAGANLTNGNPQLATLGNYGGLTLTMPPLPGSPAIDASVGSTFTTDQRGYPVSGIPDLGATEGKLIVTTAADELDVPAPSGTGISLREAIRDAPDNGVIIFAPALSGQVISLTRGEIVLGKTLTIDAGDLPAGLTIGGNGLSRILQVNTSGFPPTIVLRGLTLTGGNAASDVNAGAGGAIYIAIGTVTLSQCTLTGNTADYGGAIANNGQLTLLASTLSGNSAGAYGGAIENTLALTLMQSTLSGNSASVGGAIHTFLGTSTLVQSTISGNSATTSHGAIYNSAAITANNCIIAGNQAPDFPDANFTPAGANLITGDPKLAPLGNYGGPTQTMPPLSGSPAIDAAAGGPAFTTDQRGVAVLGMPDLGAVEAGSRVTTAGDELDTPTGLNVSLREAVRDTPTNGVINFAASLSGQSLMLTRGSIPLNKNLTIDTTNLTAGFTISGGGASRIFYISSSPTIFLRGLTLTGGRDDVGGAIYILAGGVTLRQCTLYGNSGQYGGAICLFQGALTLVQSTLSGNLATNLGGAIYNYNYNGPLTLVQSTFAGNSAFLGGAIFSDSPATTTATNCIIAGNTAVSSPNWNLNLPGANLTSGDPLLAALGNYGGSTPTMPPLPGSPATDASVGSTFITDQRGYPVSGIPDLGATEGKLMVTTAADELDGWAPAGTGVSLREAVRDTPANGVVTFTPALSGQTLPLTRGNILLNKNLTIDASDLPVGPTLSGGGLSRIFYVSSGSAVYLGRLGLTGGNGDLASGTGGAIFNDQSTVNLSQCIFYGNSASSVGGAFYNSHGTSSLAQCTFYGNSSKNGGAVYNVGSATLLQCTFTSNSAVSLGGAIYNNLTLDLQQCTIAGNSANSGGGVLKALGTVTASNCIIAGNVAPISPNLNFAPTVANLTNTTPLLASLGDYGGSTPTMPPLPGSPAIDAGEATASTTDQRGFPRVLGAAPDLGAVEGIFNPAGPGLLKHVMKQGNGAVQFDFTNYSGMPHTVLASTNVTAPLNAWTKLGYAIESPPGVFVFADLQATNYPQRFYRVQTP